jgi:RND family efflux transporter MFP subunit
MVRLQPYIYVLSLVTLTSAASLSGCSRPEAAPQPGGANLPSVSVIAPEKSMVQDTIDYTGRIEPAQRVEVRSRVSGYLEEIKFRDGQLVKAGDPLFVIDQQPFIATRDRARANLAEAQAREKLGSAQFERVTRLVRSGASSTEELDRARGEFESAQATVMLRQAELRSAELELSFTTIKAPISGMVSDRRVDVGNYLAGGTSQGGMLTTIVSQSPVRAMVDLSEADFQRLRNEGKFPDHVQVSLDGVKGMQAATIDFVDNEVSAHSGTVRLRASLANSDHAVMPGNFARVRIPVGPQQERLLVPDAAILSDQAKKLVLVVDANGQVSRKQVELGNLVGDKHVVLTGLKADDRVIISGGQRAKPGDKVQINAAPAKA